MDQFTETSTLMISKELNESCEPLDSGSNEEIVFRGNFIKFFHLLPFPPGFKRFAEVKIIFLLTFLIHAYFFGLFYFLSNITYLVPNYLKCNFNETDQFRLSTILYSLSWILAPIPCHIADRYRGRHKVISDCFILSMLGTILLVAMQSARLSLLDPTCSLIISTYTISYLLIALGSSGLLVIIIPYGVDQLEGANEETLSRFFYWYTWFTCLGDISIYGQYRSYEFVNYSLEDSINILGNAFLAVLVLFFAIFIFKLSLALGALNRVAPSGNPLQLIYFVIKNAYTTRKSADPALKKYSDKTWLDYATIDMGGWYTYDEVNSVKSFFLIIPIILCLPWLFSITLQIPSDILIPQGIQMANLPINSAGPRLLANLGINLVILIVIPLIQIPVINRYYRRKLHTILSRLFTGGVLVFSGYIIAFVIEITRQYGCIGKISRIYNIWIQLPQYILIGIGKVLIKTNAFEFVYAQSPALMKGTVFGLLSTMHGIGTLLPALLYYILTIVTPCSSVGAGDEVPLVKNTTLYTNCQSCWYSVLGSDTLAFCLHSCTQTHYGILLILGITFINLVLFFAVMILYRNRKRTKIQHQMRYFNSTTVHRVN